MLILESLLVQTVQWIAKKEELSMPDNKVEPVKHSLVPPRIAPRNKPASSVTVVAPNVAPQNKSTSAATLAVPTGRLGKDMASRRELLSPRSAVPAGTSEIDFDQAQALTKKLQASQKRHLLAPDSMGKQLGQNKNGVCYDLSDDIKIEIYTPTFSQKVVAFFNCCASDATKPQPAKVEALPKMAKK
jgi:hypothetical protein